jgi:polyadenylate-binding protein
MNFQGKPSNPEAQIFVGDLSSSVVEADLYTLASRFGEVIYIRILRHFQTKESLGFAFVTFSKPTQATDARQGLNGTLLKGSYIRVAKYCRERDAEANLFLSDLPDQITAKDLESHFIQFGAILSSKVSFDKNLKSNKYGYVQFEKRESALNVLSLAKVELQGQKITVQKFLPHSERESKYARNNLYVRGFGEAMTGDEIAKIFSQYGEISSHAVMHIKDFKGNDRHFAYVCYKSPDDAVKVLNSLHGKLELGVNWYIAPHQSKAQRRAKILVEYKKRVEDWKRRNLFIKGFPTTLTETQLREICAEYGKIESVKILKTENIVIQNNVTRPEFVSKGCGFVCFITHESAAAAFAGLKMKKIEDKPLTIFFWKPKEELAKDLNMYKMKKMHAQMLQFGMIYPQMMPRGSNPPRGRFGRGEPVPAVVAKPAEQPRLPFDLKVFYDSTPEVQKRILGENLYPIVLENSNKKIAGKITGMLLEIDPDTLIRLLQNHNEVANKVKEAIEVLRKAWSNNPEALSLLAE